MALLKEESFAFESTLAGKTWLPILRDAVDSGYSLTIYFLYLSKVSENIERIRQRVIQGGHLVPTTAVRRRYPRCFYNFWNHYRLLCEDWYVFNNSSSRPKLVYSFETFSKESESERKKFEHQFSTGRLR
ncbi:MAG: hypothetical protein AB7F43_10355 [Bacteriovoracia bacterium]